MTSRNVQVCALPRRELLVEWELQSSNIWIGECFMKSARGGVTIYPDTCHGFVSGLGDTDVMHSASGNGVCPDRAPAYGMFMPDVIKSITIDGTYYFLTASGVAATVRT